MGSSINLSDVGMKLNDEDAAFHRNHVSDILHRQSIKFPGAQPVSFARRHLTELQQNDYFLCEKTDGARCLLFLTQTIQENGEPVETQLLIDRKNDYYFIQLDQLHMPPATTDGGYNLQDYQRRTLLDGELVRQRYPDGRHQLTYLIFDCLAVQGDNIMNRDYSVRIGKIKNLVLKPFQAFAKDYPDDVAAQPFQIKMKEWQLPYGTEMMFRDVIPKLPHGNDGLIFTCKNTPYVAGTDNHILKWKPPKENTVDFRLQLGSFPMEEDDDGQYEDFDQKPSIDLLIYHGGRDYRKFATLLITDSEWTAIKGMRQQIDWRIIECYRDPNTGNWRPKIEEDGTPRFRDDKEHANHVSVVESVIESIEDAVTEQDLIAVAGKVRTAYKEREKKRLEAEAAEHKRKAQQKQGQQPPKQAQRNPSHDIDVPRYED